MSEVSQETMMFKREPEKLNVAETIKEVYAALEKKVELLQLVTHQESTMVQQQS